MGISGNLKTMVLAELLQWLSQGQKTGTLVFEHEDVEKKVYFDNGAVVSSASNARSEYLGSFLAAYGYVSDVEVDRAIARQKEEKKLIGKILVEMGAVTEEQIQQTLQLKIEETIYDIFTWEEGAFEFHDGDLPVESMVTVGMDVQWIVLEGTRRLDEYNRMRELIPSEHCVPVSVTDLSTLEVEETEARILEWIDDQRSIAEISEGACTGKFLVMQALGPQVEAGNVKVVKPKIIEKRVEVEVERQAPAPTGVMPSYGGQYPPPGYPPYYQPGMGPPPQQSWPMAESMPPQQQQPMGGGPGPSSVNVGGRTLNFATGGGSGGAGNAPGQASGPVATAAPKAKAADEPPASDVAGLLEQAKACRREGALDVAFERLKKAKEVGGGSGQVTDEENALVKALDSAGVKMTSVPKLECDVNELMNLKISPQEGFMLTRVDGSYDVKSILQVSGGIPKLNALSLFWKLRKSGHVSL